MSYILGGTERSTERILQNREPYEEFLESPRSGHISVVCGGSRAPSTAAARSIRSGDLRRHSHVLLLAFYGDLLRVENNWP